MDTAKELQYQIYLDARAHCGRYLLPHRFGKKQTPPDGLDLKYDACDALVAGGYAHWLSSASAFWPGLTLSGKPMTNPRQES